MSLFPIALNSINISPCRHAGCIPFKCMLPSFKITINDLRQFLSSEVRDGQLDMASSLIGYHECCSVMDWQGRYGNSDTRGILFLVYCARSCKIEICIDR